MDEIKYLISKCLDVQFVKNTLLFVSLFVSCLRKIVVTVKCLNVNAYANFE